MIKTLIVDDSPLVRSILRDFLEEDGNFEIIGEAVDGEDGIQKILSLNPDLVTLDIQMPKKNGLEVIEEVMKKTYVPIVVITSLDTAKTAYEAALRGAVEFFPKDTFSASISPEKKQIIFETLKRISGTKIQKKAVIEDQIKAVQPEKRCINAVVIAASTGGPKALSNFFSLLPGDFSVPIIIVQHNSSGFDRSFAEWLSACTTLNVKLAEEGEIPKAGNVYIAITDLHLMIKGDERNFHLAYNDGGPEINQKPAADVLFRTAAGSLKETLISIVLTGMGSDGALGTIKIKEKGGITIAQDEESSLIYGMPKAAAETGCVDIVLPLDKIPCKLLELTQP